MSPPAWRKKDGVRARIAKELIDTAADLKRVKAEAERAQKAAKAKAEQEAKAKAAKEAKKKAK
jgi:colicin import membrane protein